jgi:hypothetical protein
MMSRRLMMAGGAAAIVAPGLVSSGPASTLLQAQVGPRGSAIPRDPAKAAAAPPVRLGDTIFTADDPAAEWHKAGHHTVRVFLRKGPWALIWYLQAASPVDGKPFDVVVVERQRWNNLAAETPAASYRASVFGRDYALYGHGDFQRWVAASRSWPVSDRELNRWQSYGMLLPWGIGPKLQAPSEWSYMDPVPDYVPLDKGGLTPGMGTTGLRDEVGPIVHRQARYIMERSAEMRRVSMNYGLTAASIPWHVRGADGAPLLLDTPNIPLKLQQYYQNYPEERIISVSPGMQFDWDIDNAHRPCPSLIPALLSELHPFFVEEQVFSACAVLNTVTPDYRGASGKLVDQGQGRDWAWSMRDLLLAYALLRSMPPQDWLPEVACFDAILVANLERAVKALGVPGMGQLGMFWEEDAYDSEPNPTFWPSIRTGQRPGVYTGMIVNYIAYTLDWGRRLHGDPRWSELQTAFAERFQARRFLASGPFCFLNLPARLEGRWFSDWRQMAQAVGLPADIARQPWHAFDKPVNDPRVYEYTTEYPATFYHGLKLAQEAGANSADVDTAIALMEAQIRRGDTDSYPAFAMRHSR